MTLKYLYIATKLNAEQDLECIEFPWEHCHIPVDKIVLRNLKKEYPKRFGKLPWGDVPWSRMDDYEHYIEFQNSVFELVHSNADNNSALELDFTLWK